MRRKQNNNRLGFWLVLGLLAVSTACGTEVDTDSQESVSDIRFAPEPSAGEEGEEELDLTDSTCVGAEDGRDFASFEEAEAAKVMIACTAKVTCASKGMPGKTVTLTLGKCYQDISVEKATDKFSGYYDAVLEQYCADPKKVTVNNAPLCAEAD